MKSFSRAGLSVVVSMALVGCAVPPVNKPLKQEVKAAINPVDLYVGIAQPDLYAAFEPSMAGASSAAACGAVPGLGILLAAVCGGAMGAVDASVNASRAKTAEEQIQPLKNAALDIQFDNIFNDTIAKSLKGAPGFRFGNMVLTKVVTPKAYEETYRTTASNAVMFITLNYNLSTDFSTLEVSSHALVFPKSPAALSAAGVPAEALKQETFTTVNNAAYRTQLSYRGTLETKAASPAEYVQIWSADNARLLRVAVHDAATQTARLLSEEIQRLPVPERAALKKEQVARMSYDLLAEEHGGKLLRDPLGRLVFMKTLTKEFVAASAESPKPAAAIPVADAKTAP